MKRQEILDAVKEEINEILNSEETSEVRCKLNLKIEDYINLFSERGEVKIDSMEELKNYTNLQLASLYYDLVQALVDHLILNLEIEQYQNEIAELGNYFSKSSALNKSKKLVLR